MGRLSAGILMYRRRGEELQVLLVHPGGPFWRDRDQAAWSIPKGEVDPGEELQAAARREFAEELGFVPTGTLRPLGRIRQAGGKQVEAFALEGDCDPEEARSNNFQMEWPPRSGHLISFPEVDRAAWFALPAAHGRIVLGQRAFLERLGALGVHR